MTQQQMDQMNDSLQDQMLAAYERQQERDYDAMVNEEAKEWSPSEQDYIDCFLRRREFEVMMYQINDQNDTMMNEEPPFDDEIEEESIYYASNPYTTKGAKWKQ